MRPAVAEIPPSQVSGRAPGLGTRQLWEAVRGSLGLGSCNENSMDGGVLCPGLWGGLQICVKRQWVGAPYSCHS